MKPHVIIYGHNEGGMFYFEVWTDDINSYWSDGFFFRMLEKEKRARRRYVGRDGDRWYWRIQVEEIKTSTLAKIAIAIGVTSIIMSLVNIFFM